MIIYLAGGSHSQWYCHRGSKPSINSKVGKVLPVRILLAKSFSVIILQLNWPALLEFVSCYVTSSSEAAHCLKGELFPYVFVLLLAGWCLSCYWLDGVCPSIDWMVFYY